jgi:hypothetical protein
MNSGMQTKLIKHFIDSAAGLLAAWTTAFILANMSTLRLTQPHDPILAIPMDVISWVSGLTATTVICVCILVRQTRFRLATIFWFSSTLTIYRFGLPWIGVANPNGYIGPLAQTFDLSNVSTNILLNALFLYLAAMSAIMLKVSR